MSVGGVPRSDNEAHLDTAAVRPSGVHDAQEARLGRDVNGDAQVGALAVHAGEQVAGDGDGMGFGPRLVAACGDGHVAGGCRASGGRAQRLRIFKTLGGAAGGDEQEHSLMIMARRLAWF